MFPPAGLPPHPQAAGGGRPALPPSTGFSPLQPPMNLGALSVRHQSAALLLESMGRAEEAMKAAMQQCITNARNVHNELTILQQGMTVLRSANVI